MCPKYIVNAVPIRCHLQYEEPKQLSQHDLVEALTVWTCKETTLRREHARKKNAFSIWLRFRGYGVPSTYTVSFQLSVTAEDDR